MNKPLISVIIPVYNGERFLAEAIQNVLQQAYQPAEIIVVDDGSTDHTAQVASQFSPQITYRYQPNSGPAAARNAGITLAQGEFITFLDVDDLWPANKLHTQLAYFQQDPTLDIVMGHTQQLVLIQSPTRSPQFMPKGEPIFSPLFGSMLIRQAVFTQVGLLDPAMPASEDVDWLLRVREQGCALKVIQEPTLFYRRHGHNMTCGKNLVQLHVTRAIKQSLDRRRKEFGRATNLPNMLASIQSHV